MNVVAENGEGRTYTVPSVTTAEIMALRRALEETSEVISVTCGVKPRGDGSVRLKVNARVGGQALDELLLPVFRSTLGRPDCSIVPR